MMLDRLVKHHDLWIKILINLGCEKIDADDLVQDMYIRIYDYVKNEERIFYDDDINKYFVYKVLRNMYFSYLKDGYSNVFPVEEIFDKEDENNIEEILDENAYFAYLMDSINDMVKDWTPYDKKLFDLYFIRGLSLRKISKGTNIGLSSIHNSILNYKKQLRDVLLEDLEDYFNGDYSKLNL
jgi:RNA polymerase sigma factor (sigma-70 family)